MAEVRELVMQSARPAGVVSACRRVLAGAVLLLACSGEGSGGDARALLQQLRSLELEAPLSERQARIERLRAMALADAELARTRDACVNAHGKLLESEVAQGEVRAALEQARAGETGEDTGRLGRRLRASEAALETARAAFVACRDRTRALAKKYR